ncbi:MAG: hypothetical protein AAFR84_03060 [Pseudomonadota bacterium]
MSSARPVRRAKFTQADVERAIRAAMSTGQTVSRIEIEPDGRIVVVTQASERQGALR